MKTILISCLITIFLFSLYNNYKYNRTIVICNNTIDSLNKQLNKNYWDFHGYKQMIECSLEHTDYLIKKLDSNKVNLYYDDTVKLYLPAWYVLKDEY